MVEIRDVERTDAELGQSDEVHAAHATQSGDRNAFSAQRQLIRLGEPPEVALESGII